jgi:predicted NBD/HSP70 family sugar kinase
MPVVEKVRGGTVRVRGIGKFSVGDRADVSTADAGYLCDERGDFERVAEDAGDGDEADEGLADLTYDELMERAREQDIDGRSQMDKADLVDALQED